MDAGDLISSKYRLTVLLGAGRMGSVWAARNELTNRDFAVKFLRPELSQDFEALERFFLEARTCGQIRHPALAEVFDVGMTEAGSPYLVMELLEGEGLDQRLARRGRVRPTDLCRWMVIIARGLQAAHGRGLVHRDLRPGTIFFAVNKHDEVTPKILDFGIAKEVILGQFGADDDEGENIGSLAYKSPEQLNNAAHVDGRSDLWALGVVMYKSLTGQLPFGATDPATVTFAIASTPHTPVADLAPEVPPELAAVIDRLLAKNPHERFATAGQLADELEQIYRRYTDVPISQPERSGTIPEEHRRVLSSRRAWYQWAPTLRRKRRDRVVLAALGVLALAGLVLAGWAWSRDAPVSVIARTARLRPVVSSLANRATLELEREAARRRAQQPAPAEPTGGDENPPEEAPPRPPTVRAVSTGDDPHKGVVNPGF